MKHFECFSALKKYLQVFKVKINVLDLCLIIMLGVDFELVADFGEFLARSRSLLMTCWAVEREVILTLPF